MSWQHRHSPNVSFLSLEFVSDGYSGTLNQVASLLLRNAQSAAHMLDFLTAAAVGPLRLLTISINTTKENYTIQNLLYFLDQILQQRGPASVWHSARNKYLTLGLKRGRIVTKCQRETDGILFSIAQRQIVFR